MDLLFPDVNNGMHDESWHSGTGTGAPLSLSSRTPRQSLRQRLDQEHGLGSLRAADAGPSRSTETPPGELRHPHGDEGR